MDRETIVKIIMRECWGVTDDEDPGSVMPRIAGFAADAILAAIGTPDATGDLLMRAAERKQGVTTAGIWFEVKGGAWSVSMYTCPTDDYLKPIGDGPTPADALRAALAAAEEGR